uniref:Neur_chan_LBD domain-containing protein n=1 Tax=Globodera pallida TaxID=36090 RepID=A0A183C9W9_GLOPA
MASFSVRFVAAVATLIFAISGVTASDDEERLMDQIMHTNVWLTLKWHDFQLKWNPVNYGGIKELRVSPEKVWLPDIVLFNNADGNYEVSFMSNVIIRDNGDMLWVPPAIYKSSCIIDVEYFPRSHIWDVIGAPATLVNRRSRIEFQIRLRRKTLFYTIVLIIPTVLMAFLSMAVFFLPTDSGEKMTLTISVLLSIVVFLLVVSKILPPTSSNIPLMAKYLLLTFVLNIITIAVTVVIINIYFRGPTTHTMPEWVRTIFLRIMPRLLCMQRPARPSVHARSACSSRRMTRTVPLRAPAVLPGIGEFACGAGPSQHHPHCAAGGANGLEQRQRNVAAPVPLGTNAMRAIDAIEYITDHLRKDEQHKMHRDDWKYVAMHNALNLNQFCRITLGGTIGVLLSAPYVFQHVDQDIVLKRLVELYKQGDQLF